VQLEESFELPFPRDVAWEAFRDITMLVSCLPGAKLTSGADADPLQLVFPVKLGPISANFGGQGSVTYNDDYSGSLAGSGVDRATNSRVKGDAKFALHETTDGTRVHVLVDYALTGALAQFGRPGIVKEIASNITQQFAANLRARLAERVPAQGAPVKTASPPAETRRAAPAQLDAGGLLWRVLWGRIKRLFGA
jgi:carbon monoxide dehydrogenase subunit G